MWTLSYWKQLTENVVGAFAGATLSVLGVDALSLWAADWHTALGVGGGAAVLSLLKGLLATTTGRVDSPSLRRHG